mmetsp:Transcript_29231/g.44633  ORF Transcript_29231/g.44633 Transcript_29231/m.44633 type:complete len:323 (+) Transcript_29231:215-1183(+)
MYFKKSVVFVLLAGCSASFLNGAAGFIMTLPTETRHLPSSTISSYSYSTSTSTSETRSLTLQQLKLSADENNNEAKASVEAKSKDENEIDELEIIELTDDKIAEMIEVTFIKACFQLATGYVDVLKLFLASTSAAYERKIALPALIQSVDDCPANTAGRDLSQQELEVRQMWIMICYLTLHTIDRLEYGEGESEGDGDGGSGEGSSTSKEVDVMKDLEALEISKEIRSQYGALVEAIVRRDLESLGGQQGEGESESESVEELSNDVVAKSGGDASAAALLGYVVKVSSLTVSNAMEARLANEKLIDEDAVGPPRPNIPGAYK